MRKAAVGPGIWQIRQDEAHTYSWAQSVNAIAKQKQVYDVGWIIQPCRDRDIHMPGDLFGALRLQPDLPFPAWIPKKLLVFIM